MSQETTSSNGNAFAIYFGEQKDHVSSITVSEDGTITITGLLSGDEAVSLLGQASQLLYDFMRTRPLPNLILKSDVPRRDPPGAVNTRDQDGQHDLPNFNDNPF